MFHRHHWAVALLCGVFCMMTAAVATADDASAASLFKQFMQQYTEGDLQAATETGKKIDPLQLPKEQRVEFFEAFQDIERVADSQADPATLLQKGLDAQRAGQQARAATYLRAVIAHAQSTDAQKQTAAAKLAESRRLLNADLARARQTIDSAIEDIKAGKVDEAERKLQSVKDSGVDLGWFDNERVDRQMARIKEIRDRGGVMPVNGASPRPVSNDPNDPLTQAKNLFAQEKVAEARAAERNQQHRLAMDLYETALKIDPNNAAAQEGLTAARAKSNQSMAPRDVLDQTLVSTGIQQAATIAEFRQLVGRAEELRAAGNYSSAIEALNQAKITLDRNQRTLPASRYRELREDAIRLTATIQDEQRLADLDRTRATAARTTSEAEAKRIEALRETEVEVQNLLRRAADLRREQNYDRALELLNQAMFLDPNNPATQLMKETIEDTINFVKIRDLRRKRQQAIHDHSVEAAEATIPYTDLMTFPADWPELTAKRLAGLDDSGGVSEVNRIVENKLREPVPVNFDANKLVSVIEYLRNATGVNIYVNWTALLNAGIEQDMPISLQLGPIPAGQALDLVLKQASAGNEFDPITYSVHQGIVKISTSRELKRETVFSRTYDIRDLLVQVPTFENAPRFDLASALGSGDSGSSGSSNNNNSNNNNSSNNNSSGSGGGTGGFGGGSLFGSSSSTTDSAAAGPTRDELVTEILELIRTQIGRQEDWVDFGGDVSSVRELNGLLIVRSTPESHTELNALLTQLRETRAMQISVEARFLLVDQNFLDEVGVDVDVQIGDGGDGDKFGPFKIGQDSYGQTSRPIATGLPGSFGSAAPAIGALEAFAAGSGFAGSGRSLDLSFYYLDDWGVNVLIRASHANRRAISLTAPRITFFNGQRAYVTIARQIAFISDLEPVPDAQGFNPTLSVTQSGVVLDVEGTISADRRYVTMTVLPSLATIAEIRRVEFFVVDNNNNNTNNTNNNNNNNNNNENDSSSGLAIGALEAPQIELTSLATTVSVPDKGTLLLGGQRLVGDIEIEAGVPVLSKIPFINRFFTNRTKIKDERILLILIKPTIIIQGELEQDLFPGLLQNPRQFNVGRPMR